MLGALLVGGVYGGIGGAIGMTIGDLFYPVYVVYAPKTFILKFCIGLITGLIAHKIGHISTSNDNKQCTQHTDSIAKMKRSCISTRQGNLNLKKCKNHIG